MKHEGNKPGFDFLVFTIRQWKIKSTKQRFKRLIKPLSKSIKIHYRKLVKIFDTKKTSPTKSLMAKLNPVRRGLAN